MTFMARGVHPEEGYRSCRPSEDEVPDIPRKGGGAAIHCRRTPFSPKAAIDSAELPASLTSRAFPSKLNSSSSMLSSQPAYTRRERKHLQRRFPARQDTGSASRRRRTAFASETFFHTTVLLFSREAPSVNHESISFHSAFVHRISPIIPHLPANLARLAEVLSSVQYLYSMASSIPVSCCCKWSGLLFARSSAASVLRRQKPHEISVFFPGNFP